MSLPRREPKQAPSPKTKRPCRNGNEKVQWVGRQVPPFLDDAQEMGQGEQAKDRARGHDIGFQERLAIQSVGQSVSRSVVFPTVGQLPFF